MIANVMTDSRVKDFRDLISMRAFQLLVIKMLSVTTLLAHMNVPVSMALMVMVWHVRTRTSA